MDRAQRISVVLCTHNGAAYLREQVISILREDPFELVLGDDASSDDSVAIVEDLVAVHRDAGGSTQLVLRRHVPALGVVANFADGLAHARGELVALSDQDDIWHEGKLATLAAAFDADPELLLVHTDARLVDAAGAPTGLTLLQALEATPGERAGLERGDAFATLLRRNLVTGATVMLRRAGGWMPRRRSGHLGARRVAGRDRVRPRSSPAAARTADRLPAARGEPDRRPASDDVRPWAKLREPREPRASTLVARTAALVAALERLGDAVPPEHLAAARARLAHEERRRALPRVPLARVPRILRSAARATTAATVGVRSTSCATSCSRQGRTANDPRAHPHRRPDRRADGRPPSGVEHGAAAAGARPRGPRRDHHAGRGLRRPRSRSRPWHLRTMPRSGGTSAGPR